MTAEPSYTALRPLNMYRKSKISNHQLFSSFLALVLKSWIVNILPCLHHAKLFSKLEIWKQVMLILYLSLSSDVWMLPISWWQKQKAWNVVEKIALAVVLPYYQTSEYFLRFSREISPVCEFESLRQIAHPRPTKNKKNTTRKRKKTTKRGLSKNDLLISDFLGSDILRYIWE